LHGTRVGAILAQRGLALGSQTHKGGTALQGKGMATPKEMDVVRRAYELWQQAGEPSGKDDEFYHQAKKELQEVLEKENNPASSSHAPIEPTLIKLSRG
jgi:hypothetical protein